MQLLSTDGEGNDACSVDASGDGTIVSADACNVIAAGRDVCAVIVSIDDVDGDPKDGKETRAERRTHQVLITDGLGNYAWADDADSGGTTVARRGGNVIIAG